MPVAVANRFELLMVAIWFEGVIQPPTVLNGKKDRVVGDKMVEVKK